MSAEASASSSPSPASAPHRGIPKVLFIESIPAYLAEKEVDAETAYSHFSELLQKYEVMGISLKQKADTFVHE